MCRQGMSLEDVAIALGKSKQAVYQKYLKLVPRVGSAGNGRKKSSSVDMAEDVKVRLLSAVARGKAAFWAGIAKEVGEGITGPQCEAQWNEVVMNRA